MEKERNHFYAGGVAGFVSGFILHPFETVSLRYKLQSTDHQKRNVLKNMWKNEPITCLWRGMDAGLAGTIPTTAFYFLSYLSMKEIGEKSVSESFHPIIHMVSGATSELVSSVVYVPFEVVKARMQLGTNPNLATNGAVQLTENYKNSYQAMKQIYLKEGKRGLYAGYGPCIITDTTFRGFQFLFYEYGKKNFGGSSDDVEEPSTVKDLIIGGFSGALSAVVTNPFDVITVRLMTKGIDLSSSSRDGNSTKLAFRQLYHSVITEGIHVLFAGALWRSLALAPHSAITFAVFEYTLRWLKL